MEILITILLSALKFGMTFPLAIIEFGFSYFETILWINLGGIAGIYFFAYLSQGVILWIKKKFNRRKRSKPEDLEISSKKRVFTRRNRRLITIKQKYGLIGIAMSTPILLSIPIGVFLVVRYYSTIKTRFAWLILGNIIWSFLYTSFYMYWNDRLFTR